MSIIYAQLTRYIHLNPVKAQLATSPEKHAFTSHICYLNKKKSHSWLTTQKILSYFSNRENLAKRKFHDFVLAGVPEEISNFYNKKKTPSIIGKNTFEELIYRSLHSKNPELTFEGHKYKTTPQLNTETLKSLLLENLEQDWNSIIYPKGYHSIKMRKFAIGAFKKYTNLSYKEISFLFNNINPSTILRASQFYNESNSTLKIKIETAISSI